MHGGDRLLVLLGGVTPPVQVCSCKRCMMVSSILCIDCAHTCGSLVGLSRSAQSLDSSEVLWVNKEG